jgi:hypothetical protein
MLAYMSMHHFAEANKIIDVIFDRGYWKDPELYFRRAQITYMNKSSSLKQLRDASELVTAECLNETVLAGKKWANAIKRFQSLKEKIEEAV